MYRSLNWFYASAFVVIGGLSFATAINYVIHLFRKKNKSKNILLRGRWIKMDKSESQDP